MKRDEIVEVPVGYILINAYREEARLYREAGNERRANQYERLADRMEQSIKPRS